MKETEWMHDTWNLLHCIPIKIKKNEFFTIKETLFENLKRICSKLPCPDCAHHASIYISNVNFNNIKTKEDLEDVFFTFHNNVNKKLKKKINDKKVLDKYSNMKFNEVLNSFFGSFNISTKGNFIFMAENHNRELFLKELLIFFKSNISKFNN